MQTYQVSDEGVLQYDFHGAVCELWASSHSLSCTLTEGQRLPVGVGGMLVCLIPAEEARTHYPVTSLTFPLTTFPSMPQPHQPGRTCREAGSYTGEGARP